MMTVARMTIATLKIKSRMVLQREARVRLLKTMMDSKRLLKRNVDADIFEVPYFDVLPACFNTDLLN